MNIDAEFLCSLSNVHFTLAANESFSSCFIFIPAVLAEEPGESPVETSLLSIKWLDNFDAKCKAFQYKWKQVHDGPQAVNIVPALK